MNGPQAGAADVLTVLPAVAITKVKSRATVPVLKQARNAMGAGGRSRWFVVTRIGALRRHAKTLKAAALKCRLCGLHRGPNRPPQLDAPDPPPTNRAARSQAVAA